ncbi:MAG: hypothetical protein VX463_18825, partial [Pseudomonadota bacterium]|nr:hypothetical protein [Pseudomonadota bacterium]
MGAPGDGAVRLAQRILVVHYRRARASGQVARDRRRPGLRLGKGPPDRTGVVDRERICKPLARRPQNQRHGRRRALRERPNLVQRRDVSARAGSRQQIAQRAPSRVRGRGQHRVEHIDICGDPLVARR